MAIKTYIEVSILLILALGFGLALRLPFAMQNDSSNSDQWGVLGKIKKHIGLRWIDYTMPDAIPAGIFPYPMFVHFIISRFQQHYWKPLNIFINQASDLVVGVLVFGMILYLGPVTTFPGTDIVGLAWMGTLLFLSLPLFLPISARMKAHNGRCFGMLLNTIYLLGLYWVITTRSELGAIACIILLLIIYLSSFFAMQTAIYFSVGLAICYFDWTPVAVVAISLIISFLFPQLGARDTLVFKVNHFKWYWKNYTKNTTATGRNLFKNFFLLFKHFPSNPIACRAIFFRTSPLWIALYSAPCFWILLSILVYEPKSRLPLVNDFAIYCLVLTILTLVVFIVTSTGKLVIFGTAERYLEYSAPFFVVLFSLSLSAGGFDSLKVFMALIVFQVGIIMFNDVTYRKRFFKWIAEPECDTATSVQGLFRYLSTIPGGARIATVPIKLPILLRAYNPSPETIKFYYRFIQQSLKLDGFNYFEEDIIDLNVFGGTAEDLVKKYGITHVVCQRSYLKPGTFEFIDSLINHQIVYENENYVLYSSKGPKIDGGVNKNLELEHHPKF